MLRWFSFLVLLFVSLSGTAAETITCTAFDVKLQNKNFMLTTPGDAKTSQAYFLKNSSKQSIWLDHPVARPSASAGWSSFLRPGRGSVLVLDRKNFAVSCAVISPGKVEYLDCGKVVSVCLVSHGSVGAKKGTYWLVEDKAWEDVVKVLMVRLKGLKT